MKMQLATLGLIGLTSIAGAQAVTSITGGSAFGGFYGDTTNSDVVGWRFDTNTDIIVTDLGVYSGALNPDGLTSSHMVGIWDSNGNLLTSTTAGPGGTVVGDWTYADTADITLTAGDRYTVGAGYNLDDGDSYVSGPSSIDLAPEINPTTNGVFPDESNLGFTFPGSDSTNLGRFGPNFLFVPVPAPSALALLGLGGLVAARRRR